MGNINLDDLGGSKGTTPDAAAKPTADAGEMGLVISKSRETVFKDRSLPAIIDEKQKLIYLIDRSGSQKEIVASPEAVAAYIWDPETMANIRKMIASAKAIVDAKQLEADKLMGEMADEEVEDSSIVDIPTYSPREAKLALMANLSDDDVKIELIKTGLVKEIGRRDYSKPYDDLTKFALVKKMTKKMIQERYKKYPNADVSVILFDMRFDVIPAPSERMQMDIIMNAEAGGGTDIFGAVEVAINVVKSSPSPVRMNHFVLVTDGQDHSGKRLPELLPTFKELGISLDFIFMLQPGDDYTAEIAKVIREVAEATGGLYKEVLSAKEFEDVFLEASTRKLLTAGS